MPESFHNIVDYVWRHPEPFSERPLCRVDSLVLCQLAYFQLPSEAIQAWGWTGLPIRDLWRSDWLDKMCGRMYDPPGAKRLAAALAASPRFRDVEICHYVMQIDHLTDMQFSAMTFRISPDQTYIAFRGTDNTIVGWKENLNMAFQVQVPSQAQAVRYVEHAARHVSGGIWLGGHSKGGNMAIYTGLTCKPEVRSRLLCCFSHDGPGFTAYTRADLEPDVHDAHDVPFDKTVPKSSVFGMLFDQQDQDARVVRSVSSGFAQHDPLSWEVEGCDFVMEEHLGRTASYVDNSLNTWIRNASLEERQRFVEAIFTIMDAPEERYTHDIRTKWRTTLPVMARAALDLDPEVRDVLVHKVLELLWELAPGDRNRGEASSEL